MISIIFAVLLFVLLASLPNPGSSFYIQPEVIQFIKHPHSQVLLKNTSLILECALNLQSLDQSVPIPIFKWQYNGEDDSVHCENSVSYQNLSIISECLIESVIVNDTGWYRCAVIDGETNCTLPCYSTITVSASAYVLVIDETEDTDVLEAESNCSSVLLLPFEILYSSLTDVIVMFELFWEKDGIPVGNMTEIQQLPSGSLLIQTASDNLLGTYTCVSENGVIIKTYNVLLNDNSSYSSLHQLKLVVLSAYYSSSFSEYFFLPNTKAELICQQIDMSPAFSWLLNGIELKTEYNHNWLLYNNMKPGNYCCITNGSEVLTTCVTITNKVQLSMDSTIYVNSNHDSVSSVLLNCSSSINDMIYWLHNGNLLPVQSQSNYYDISNVVNVSSIIGIYQCLLQNGSVTALCTYRILPFGITNPPSSVTLSIYPPAMVGYGGHTITCSPPLYTGSLNGTVLKYKVLVNDTAGPIDDAPGCPSDPSNVCEFLCTLDFFDTGNGYRIFYVYTINADGDAVSQLSNGKEISALLCDVYVPATPKITYGCMNDSTYFQWEKAVIAFSPDEEYTIVDLICFSEQEKIVEYSNIVQSPSINNNSIQPTEVLLIGDVCSFTAYGSSSPCTGAKTIAICTITTQDSSNTLHLHSLMPIFAGSSSLSQIMPETTSSYFSSGMFTSASTTATSTSNSSAFTPLFSMSSSSSSFQYTNSPVAITSSSIALTTSIDISSTFSTFSTATESNHSMTVPNPSTLLTSSIIGSGAVTAFIFITVIIICSIAFIRHSVWKKKMSIYFVDIDDVIPSGDRKPKELCPETADTVSIVTILEQPIMDLGIATIETPEESLFVPKRNARDPIPLEMTESNDSKEQLTRMNSSVDNILQALSTPTSDSTDFSCKTSTYSSGSNLSHKTSGYSSISDHSGFSIRSDSTPDYVGFDAYAKQAKLNYHLSLSQQSDELGSERMELSVLGYTCPPILEQSEDRAAMDSIDHEQQQYQLVMARLPESEFDFHERLVLNSHVSEMTVLNSCDK